MCPRALGRSVYGSSVVNPVEIKEYIPSGDRTHVLSDRLSQQQQG
ncbi:MULTISPECIES: hypothetical protein [unclassified Microcoleus]